MPMAPHFEILAPIYDRLIPAVDPEFYRRLLDLPVEGALLDAGGGTGRVSVPLRQWVNHLVVADSSEAMLRRAGKKGGIRCVRCAAERLPFAKGAFERILVADALHHFRSPSLALKELARVLTPGGRLVVEEPDINRPLIRLLALMEKLALMKSRFFTVETLAEMAAADNLSATILRGGRFLAWLILLK